jgi:hypothetical protein
MLAMGALVPLFHRDRQNFLQTTQEDPVFVT